MLPFLKLRKAAGGVITQVRPHDEGKEPEGEDAGLEMAMEDFCAAHESKDYAGMAKAFRAAFDMLEVQPHDEISHEDQSE